MTVYRYKFSCSFSDELISFATIHRHDPYFKESWGDWVKEHSALVDLELRRLIQLEYSGDMAAKMYKSVRYYYKNKPLVPAKPKKRKKYVRLSSDILEYIDRDIALRAGKKPAIAFTEFLEKIQCEEVMKLLQGVSSSSLKKAYKNRFYKAYC